MNKPDSTRLVGHCQTCRHWDRLGEWWGRCNNDGRTAIETEDPGAGPEMTRKTFMCSAWSGPTVGISDPAKRHVD